MSLRFKGGERLQRGRGIGGLLRLAKSLFSPIVRSVGKTAVKAATSKIGKKVIEEIKDQAVSTGINMMADAVRGKDMKESAKRELKAVKHGTADMIESLNPIKETRKKVKTTVKRSRIRHVPIKYQDNPGKQDFMG